MIRSQRVLETGVSGSGIDQEAMPDLADVPKTLNGGRVEREKCRTVDTDVIPEWISDDLGFAGNAFPPG